MAIYVKVDDRERLGIDSLKKLISEKKNFAAAIYPAVSLCSEYEFIVIDLYCFRKKEDAKACYASFQKERRFDLYDLIPDGGFIISKHDIIFRICEPATIPPQIPQGECNKRNI